MPYLISAFWGLLSKLWLLLIPFLGGIMAWAVVRGIVTFFTIAGVGVATFGGSFFAINLLEDSISDSLLGLNGLPLQMTQGVLHVMDLMQFDFALSAVLTGLSIRVSIMLSGLIFTRKATSGGGGWSRPQSPTSDGSLGA